jgi:glycosyltransferase involved in cell wall biosynthesis
VTRTLTIGIDQLYRRQPGGIGTYVRGLVLGLHQVAPPDLEILGLAPRGETPASVRGLALTTTIAPLPVEQLTRMWKWQAFGVPGRSTIVHATSMAGPYGGGARGAVHSVAMHDLLWREGSSATTNRGARFHEDRLALLKRRSDLRIFSSSPGLREQLVAEGIDGARVFDVRLGVDDDTSPAADEEAVRATLAARGVAGPFTLYVGTREPRKNLERLIDAHAHARSASPELGPLVLAGPAGWGEVATGDAIVLGTVSRELLKGLYRDATVFAYVAMAEGWGLPPVEALHAGTRVVASTTTPSVARNGGVVRVDPHDVSAIAQGLVDALSRGDDEASRSSRRTSVADLTWANSARDHLAGWS